MDSASIPHKRPLPGSIFISWARNTCTVVRIPIPKPFGNKIPDSREMGVLRSNANRHFVDIVSPSIGFSRFKCYQSGGADDEHSASGDDW